MPSHLEEIRSRAQGMIAGAIYADAPETSEMLQKVAAEIAANRGCKVVTGPIKRFDRAAEKVTSKFGGDWFGLTDAVRVTLVVPSSNEIAGVQAEVRFRCTPDRGMSLMKDVDLRPEDSPCGYSGLNFVVRFANGQPGEIQVNSAPMMYGQLSERAFKDALGDDTFQAIHNLYGIEGGLGHTFYEIYRVAPDSAAGKSAADVSRQYFAYLRGFPDMTIRPRLQTAIDGLRSQNLADFAKASA